MLPRSNPISLLPSWGNLSFNNSFLIFNKHEKKEKINKHDRQYNILSNLLLFFFFNKKKSCFLLHYSEFCFFFFLKLFSYRSCLTLNKLQFISVAQSCPALCSPTDCNTLSFTISWSLLKLMSIKLVMPSHHLILCYPLLLLL